MTDTPKRPRRHFTNEQKAEIVRRHLRGKEPVSHLANEFDVQPTQIHTWVNLVLEQAERAFEKTNGAPRVDQAKDRKIEQLEAKVQAKNEVIAELMQEHVTLKKELGEL
jgi:transposase